MAVAVDVALDVVAAGDGEGAQLAGDMAEGRRADEAEGLVARGEGVGVDRREVDAITLGVAEVDDGLAAIADLAGGRIAEDVRAGPRSGGARRR